MKKAWSNQTAQTTKDLIDAANTTNGQWRPYASGLDIKFAFGDDNDIQITYKVEPVNIMHSATLSYTIDCNNVESCNSGGGCRTSNRTAATKKPSKAGVKG